MTEQRGEFTRKFDREILGDETAAREEELHRQRLAEAGDKALEAEFHRIMNVLEYRAQWLRERFPSCVEPKQLSFRGRRFEFIQQNEVVGWLEFHTRLTDSQQGIMVQSFMELRDQFPKRCDYVSFPKEKVNLDRVKRFVESKLLEFAGPYQDAYGAATATT
jgi:hypothetical protein